MCVSPHPLPPLQRGPGWPQGGERQGVPRRLARRGEDHQGLRRQPILDGAGCVGGGRLGLLILRKIISLSLTSWANFLHGCPKGVPKRGAHFYAQNCKVMLLAEGGLRSRSYILQELFSDPPQICSHLGPQGCQTSYFFLCPIWARFVFLIFFLGGVGCGGGACRLQDPTYFKKIRLATLLEFL